MYIRLLMISSPKEAVVIFADRQEVCEMDMTNASHLPMASPTIILAISDMTSVERQHFMHA